MISQNEADYFFDSLRQVTDWTRKNRPSREGMEMGGWILGCLFTRDSSGIRKQRKSSGSNPFYCHNESVLSLLSLLSGVCSVSTPGDMNWLSKLDKKDHLKIVE